jgi:hypothetical protein
MPDERPPADADATETKVAPQDTDRDLERAIAGALRDAIRAHGPITPARIGSAAKRIAGQLRNARGLESRVAATLGRKGGAAGRGESKRREVDYSSMAATRWAGMTAEERSAEMKRRAAKRKRRTQETA